VGLSTRRNILPAFREFAGSSPLAEILEAKVEPVTDDVTGQIARGHIQLRGFLKMFTVAKRNLMNRLEFKNQGYKSNALAYFDDPGARVGSLWWTLPIYASFSMRGRPVAVGLILARVEVGDYGDQTYQRKGVFAMEDDIFASKDVAKESEEIARAVREQLASNEEISGESEWNRLYPYRLDIPWEERVITII
jgi:hypothetical protein